MIIIIVVIVTVAVVVGGAEMGSAIILDMAGVIIAMAVMGCRRVEK